MRDENADGRNDKKNTEEREKDKQKKYRYLLIYIFSSFFNSHFVQFHAFISFYKMRDASIREIISFQNSFFIFKIRKSNKRKTIETFTH